MSAIVTSCLNCTYTPISPTASSLTRVHFSFYYVSFEVLLSLLFLSLVVGALATLAGEEMFGLLCWNGAIRLALLCLAVHRRLSALHDLSHFANLQWE